MLVDDSDVHISGITTKDMNHKYRIHSESIDIFNLIKKYGLLDKVSSELLNDLSGEKRLLDVNIDKIENQSLLYKGNLINLNASVKDLVYNMNSKSLSSGLINIDSDMPNGKYYDKLNTSINIDDIGYNIVSKIYTNGGVVNLEGTTNKSLEHRYKLEGQSINVVSFLKNIDMLNETDIKDKNLIYDFKVGLRGKGTNIAANFEASSEYGQYSNIEYEKMYIKGETKKINWCKNKFRSW